ncbi:MAG: TIGR02147 family protein [Bdellovibrionales bacterium]
MSSLPFDEKDYRSVIRKWVSDRPNRGRGELKIMAEKIGVPSPVFSQILSGTRELSEDHAYILSDHMEFSELQRDYFLCLVQIERASHFEYKNHLKRKLEQIQNRSKNLVTRLEYEGVLTEKDQSEFYSSWLYSAVRLFCDIRKGASFDEICSEFRLHRDRGIRIVQFLVRVGLIEIRNNVYHLGPSRTHVGKDSPYVIKHHSNWRIRAMERSQNLKDEELMFTGPMTISQKDFSQLREKMVKLVEEVSSTVKDSASEKLVCFNLDFFEVKS